MKGILKQIDLKRVWMFVFLLFFISVPLNLLSEGLGGALIFMAVALFIIHKFDIPKFALAIFAFSFVIRLVMVLLVPTPAESDFGVLLDASQKMISGDYSYLDKSYFQLWAYQLGYVFFQSIFLRIWNNMLILKILNCILGAGTTVLIYLISKEFVSKKAAQAVALIYCCLPFTIAYTTILTNQFSSSFLIYLGIYILIAKKLKMHSHIRYLIFAVLLVFADVLRPESIIPLFSAVIFLVLTIKKDNIKENLINLVILLATYFVLSSIINKLFIITGISPNGLTNNDPMWKFVLGFNHETGGSYCDADSPYLNNRDAAIELVKSRIFVPVMDLIDLFSAKIEKFWIGTSIGWSFSAFYSNGLTIFGKTFRVVDDVQAANAINSWIIIMVYLLIIIGVARYIRNKNYDSKILLILNQVFVTFGVYLLIEVQPRYIYYVQISTLILAAFGISEISKMVKKLRASDENDSKIENI